jgi:hypothetical protein
MERERICLFAFLVIAFILLVMSKPMPMFNYAYEDSNTLTSFLISDTVKWFVSSPTLSLDKIKGFLIDYQAHYKAIGNLRFSPPLQPVLMGISELFLGKNNFGIRVVSSLQAVAVLLLTYYVFRLVSEKKKVLIPGLVASFLVLFHPLFFYNGFSAMMDITITMFFLLVFYMLLLYLKTDDKKYIYLAAFLTGLAISTKPTALLLIPSIGLVLLTEKRKFFSSKNLKPISNSILLIFLGSLPFFIAEIMLSMFGYSFISTMIYSIDYYYVCDPYFTSVIGLPVYWGGCKFIGTTTIFYSLFYQPLLFPFFILPIIKRKNITNYYRSGLMFILIFVIFYLTLSSFIEPRYLLPIFPIVSVFSVNSMFGMKNKKALYALLSLLLLTAPLIAYYDISAMNSHHIGPDYDTATKYIAENTESPSTVIAQNRQQMAVFIAMYDDEKKLYIVRAPVFGNETAMNFTEQEEMRIMLESEDCVKRPSKPSWETLGLKHPPVKWVVLEESLIGSEEYDFESGVNIKDFMDAYPGFVLDRVFEGYKEGHRLFVYRRIS